MSTLLDDLKQQIQNGQAVFVIGSGVSVGATGAPTASWKGLLHDGVQRCIGFDQTLPTDWGDRVRAEIESGDMDDLLSAAEKVTRKLLGPRGGAYGKWLREAMESLEAKNTAVLESLRDLGVPLTTTNYDGLLEGATGRKPVTWRDAARMERVLWGKEPGIAHLHGSYDDPESVVLGIRSYEDVLHSPHAQQVLKSLAMTKTLVFVGFGAGLDDPNFGALMTWIETVLERTEKFHFRLTLRSEITELQKDHAVLRVWPYGDDHKDLAPFLRSLMPPKKAEPPEETVPSAVPVPVLPTLPNVVGRDEEIKRVVDALLATPPLPVPVLGTAGIGKSTVTVAALRDAAVAQRFGARRYFVRCEGALTADAMWGEIAQALQIAPGSPLQAAVLANLHAAPAALALDNFETPWEAAGQTAAAEELLKTLAAVPGLALIVALRSETKPFGVRWQKAADLRPLETDDARRVFVDIAGENFAADPHLEELLDALAGVPLAITLLAHRAQGEPNLDGLWKLWQARRTDVLQRDGVTGKDANLATSYELSLQGPRMNDAARRLLALLALLPDGVAHGDLDAIFPGADNLAGTDNASVLRRVALAHDEAGRLRLLAPLRAYVAQYHPPQDADLLLVHDHFLQLAEEGEKAGAGGGAEAIRRLIPEAGNVAAVLLDALRGDSWQRAAKASRSFAEFIRFTGYGSAAPLEDACEKCREAGDVQSEANCIQRLGDIALDRSEHEAARAQYEAALALYARIPEPYSMGVAHFRLAQVAPDGAAKLAHACAARRAFRKIDRPDYVAAVEEEFPDLDLAACAEAEDEA